MSHIIIHAIPFTGSLGELENNLGAILKSDQARASKFNDGDGAYGPLSSNPSPVDGLTLEMGGYEDESGIRTRLSEVDMDLIKGELTSRSSMDVTDSTVVYSISAGIGQPPTSYTVLIDQASANTWIGSDKTYNPTSTSSNSRRALEMAYAQGSFKGTEYTDKVTLSRSLVVDGQTIGIARETQGFMDGIDGVLGLGPVDLSTSGSNRTPDESTPRHRNITTIMDNLFNQGMIPTQTLAISFYDDGEDGKGAAINGELTFGATDTSKFTGEVNYIPITTRHPASGYWGVEVSVRCKGRKSGRSNGKHSEPPAVNGTGVVDMGSMLLLLSSDIFSAYKEGAGAVVDAATGLLTIKPNQLATMESLFFTFGSTTYELPPPTQVLPDELVRTLGLDSQKGIYLAVGDMGKRKGQAGVNVVFGYSFLRYFYSVYDVTHGQVGFALLRNGKVKIAPMNPTETALLERHTSGGEADIEPPPDMGKGESEDKLPIEKESPNDSRERDTGELKEDGELTEDAAEDDREAEDSDDSVQMSEFLKDVELINDDNLETEDDGIL